MELYEPIAAYGPFVMNTYDEVKPAVEDVAARKFGVLDDRPGGRSRWKNLPGNSTFVKMMAEHSHQVNLKIIGAS